MFKKVLVLVLALAMTIVFVACSNTAPVAEEPATEEPVAEEPVAEEPAAEEPAAEEPAAEYAKTNYNPETAMGEGPEGQPAACLADFSFSDEELQQLKDGNFKVAICYHQLGDQCNAVKCEAAQAAFKELGIEVVAVTEAQLDDTVQADQLESVIEMDVDAMLVMPHNSSVCAPILQRANEKGIKLVFMEAVAAGFTSGSDYVALVSSDGYGNGWYAATMIAEQIGYEGQVAMVYYDADYFVTNVRDQGFEQCMAANYPNIEVIKSAFTDEGNCGSNGDALMAQYPELKAVYVSWEAPADYIRASAVAAGRTDLKIVTIDLGDMSARSIATGDMISCSATSRSWDQGTCEAYCAAYALLGKEVPSTYVTPVALPVDSTNLLDGYCASYGLTEAPAWLAELLG